VKGMEEHSIYDETNCAYNKIKQIRDRAQLGDRSQRMEEVGVHGLDVWAPP
jgi:hypothetical protein